MPRVPLCPSSSHHATYRRIHRHTRRCPGSHSVPAHRTTPHTAAFTATPADALGPTLSQLIAPRHIPPHSPPHPQMPWVPLCPSSSHHATYRRIHRHTRRCPGSHSV